MFAAYNDAGWPAGVTLWIASAVLSADYAVLPADATVTFLVLAIVQFSSSEQGQPPCTEERKSVMDKIRIEQHSMGGLIWIGGWLFTIGFLKLTFWKGVRAVLLWPYYLGVWVSGLLSAGA